MSFYGSAPVPNNSTPQQPRQSRLNAAAWPDAALDQLVFQESGPSVNPMGGLRRANPQPPLNDQTFSIVEAAAAELGSFPNGPVDNERLLLETASLDFDEAFQRRPTPNHPEQAPQAARSQPQPQPNPAYRHPWEQPSAAASGGNVGSLPQEAFAIAEAFGVEPTPENFASRGKHARKVGLGPYVQQLINFNLEQQRGTREHSLERFWKPLIASYFTTDATLHIDLKSNSSSKPQPVKIPVEALPRIWKSKLDAGVINERILLENPCEFQLPNGVVVVDCPRTIIVTTYENSIVQTDGHLRVSFQPNKKIMAWEFSSQKHEEFFSKRALNMGSMLRPACSEYGIPASVARLMMIANDVSELADRIGDEISKIASDPQRVSFLQNLANAGEHRQGGSLTGFQGIQSNGSAYRALSSMLDGPHLDQSLRGTTLGVPIGRAGANTGSQGLANDLDMDVRNAMENNSNMVPNLRDAITSWKSEQQPPVMFPNLFDEAVQVPFMPGDRDDAQKGSTRNQGNMKMPGRQPTNTAGAPSKQGQSAIEAVAAAASGQGGWGMGSHTQPDLGTSGAVGAALDPSLQLLNTATDANLTLRRESETAQRRNVSRQNVPPPGLSVFTPQSNDVAKSDGPGRRERGGRGGRGSSMRGMGSGGMRTTAGGQTLKDFEGLQAFQRMASSKSKREAAAVAGQGSSGSNRGDFGGTSQGLTGQNGAMGAGKARVRGDGSKSSKDRTHMTTGTRRNSQRNPPSDERLEKRRKTVPQNGGRK